MFGPEPDFPTRFAVNAACVKHQVPLVSGAAIRFDGQIMVVRSDKPNTACYRCLYKDGADTAETCEQTGKPASKRAYWGLWLAWSGVFRR